MIGSGDGNAIADLMHTYDMTALEATVMKGLLDTSGDTSMGPLSTRARIMAKTLLDHLPPEEPKQAIPNVEDMVIHAHDQVVAEQMLARLVDHMSDCGMTVLGIERALSVVHSRLKSYNPPTETKQ